MRVLHLSTYQNLGGAAVAARRLHEGLLGLGVQSDLLVQKSEGGARVHQPPSRLARRLGQWRPLAEYLPLTLYRRRRVIHWSTAWVPTRKVRDVRRFGPNLVHAHWTNRGFASPEDLSRMPCPVVWTLHDSWAFTGGCHVPLDCVRYRQRCGRCPQLGSRAGYDLSRMLFRRKARAWRRWSVVLVTPSRWLAAAARTSPLLGRMRIETIPNGIDTRQFAPVEQGLARDLLNLDPARRYLLCVAFNAASDRNKGFAALADAVRQLAAQPGGRDLSLLVAGQSQPARPVDLDVPVHYLGVLHESLSLRMAYAAADAFVLPSMQENLPNTIMEALACGCPAVGFRVGGIPELIDDGVNGRVAVSGDAASLAEALQWVTADDARRRDLGAAGRQKVLEQYALERIASRHVALYTELVGQE